MVAGCSFAPLIIIIFFSEVKKQLFAQNRTTFYIHF